MRVNFSSGILSVEADTLGAELVSVRIDERELLWQNENGQWAGHAPVLFPVCGNCRLIAEGIEYPVGRHGFARTSEFTLKKQSRNGVTFELKSSPETLKKFPYEFIFRVKYQLIGARLRIVYEIQNPAERTLYCSCGGHESFALTAPLGEYGLRFSRIEKFDALLHDDEGRLTGETKSLGEGTYFRFPEEFLQEGRTVIFGGLRSRRAHLCHQGSPVAEIAFTDFDNLLLWRAGEANMICVEPWHNLPDGKTVGEFSTREGIMAIPPRGRRRFVRDITYWAIGG